jgi:hypothetical protein
MLVAAWGEVMRGRGGQRTRHRCGDNLGSLAAAEAVARRRRLSVRQRAHCSDASGGVV